MPMTAVLIDDEQPALDELQALLRAHAADLQVVGCYRYPEDLLAQTARLRPDVAFVDVAMPGMDGLTLARQLQQQLPKIAIVFVTAHAGYAVKAFDCAAEDYLLKPLQPRRLATTVERLRARVDQSPRQSHIRITTFGGLQVQTPNGPLTWHSSKTRELFAWLLHHHGTPINREQLLDALHPDAAFSRAESRFYNDSYHIRKSLESADVGECIRLTKLGLELSADVFWDKAHFGHLVSLAARQQDPLPSLEQAIDLYQGDYLADAQWLWADPFRERLRLQYQAALLSAATEHQRRGQSQQAEILLLTAREQDPFNEQAVIHLVELYLQDNRRPHALSLYHGYAQLLADELQAEPGSKLRALITAANR
ncbi:MAG: response regulator [Lamprobacter sp.]|uniref:response regulator n=1 Tax=Lamprobacter sp. TaxID=3100796 RepID=UPI002B260FE6|nr:response regulator [Lamprobacter sp.]MEA3642403.1 response regulator [Lamprobacter sp.]